MLDVDTDTAAISITQPRVAKFVQSYVLDGNGSAAAVAAGFSPRRARQTAYELLQRPAVQNALSEVQAGLARQFTMEASNVIHGLFVIAMDESDENSSMARVQALRTLAEIFGLIGRDKTLRQHRRTMR